MRILQSEGYTLSFVTLTQPPKVKTAQAAYAILPDQWDKFRNRWQYSARKAREKSALCRVCRRAASTRRDAALSHHRHRVAEQARYKVLGG